MFCEGNHFVSSTDREDIVMTCCELLRAENVLLELDAACKSPSLRLFTTQRFAIVKSKRHEQLCHRDVLTPLTISSAHAWEDALLVVISDKKSQSGTNYEYEWYCCELTCTILFCFWQNQNQNKTQNRAGQAVNACSWNVEGRGGQAIFFIASHVISVISCQVLTVAILKYHCHGKSK